MFNPNPSRRMAGGDEREDLLPCRESLLGPAAVRQGPSLQIFHRSLKYVPFYKGIFITRALYSSVLLYVSCLMDSMITVTNELFKKHMF